MVYNPHLKYVDLDRHGYFILDLKDDSAQADYYYVDTLRVSSNKESFGRGVVTLNNSNRITRLSSAASIGKSVQQGQAPAKAQPKNTSIKEIKNSEAIIIGAYPIPTSDLLNINYALNKGGITEIAIFDVNGKSIGVESIGIQSAGVYTYSFDVSKLPVGVYFFNLILNGQVVNNGKYIKN